jgi:hypothetical protein
MSLEDFCQKNLTSKFTSIWASTCVQLSYFLSSTIEPKDIAHQFIKLQPHACQFALAFFVYAKTNLILVMVATLLCVSRPSIASFGIPKVKAYLNGVDTPNVFSLQTLVVKVNVFTPMPLRKKLSLVNACSYHAWLLYGVNKQIKCF